MLLYGAGICELFMIIDIINQFFKSINNTHVTRRARKEDG